MPKQRGTRIYKIRLTFNGRHIGWSLVFASILWFLFWYFCPPAVVLHYDARAKEPVTYYFIDNHWTDKKRINPGESVKYPTDMFPGPHAWINLSLPFNYDEVSLAPPFSRVDIYITADGKIGDTVVRHGFLERFSPP